MATPNVKPRSIGISFRPDGDGVGSLWDHFTFQNMFPNDKTFILISSKDNHDPIEMLRRAANDKITTVTAEVGKPKHVDVIVIPGVSRKDNNQVRMEYEKRLISKYYKVKPLILICGAVWKLEMFGAEIRDVSSHCNARMMNIFNAKIRYNINIHSVGVQQNQTAISIFRKKTRSFEVNSVHWRAIESLGPTLSKECEVVLRSTDVVLKPNKQPRKQRNNEVMASQRDVIECVVSKQGPPLVAVQYHPEAYCKERAEIKNIHQNLLAHAVYYGCAAPPLRRSGQSVPSGPVLRSSGSAVPSGVPVNSFPGSHHVQRRPCTQLNPLPNLRNPPGIRSIVSKGPCPTPSDPLPTTVPRHPCNQPVQSNPFPNSKPPGSSVPSGSVSIPPRSSVPTVQVPVPRYSCNQPVQSNPFPNSKQLNPISDSRNPPGSFTVSTSGSSAPVNPFPNSKCTSSSVPTHPVSRGSFPTNLGPSASSNVTRCPVTGNIKNCSVYKYSYGIRYKWTCCKSQKREHP